MGRKTRITVYILGCGLIPMIFSAAVDGDWPDHSTRHWLVFLGGLVVFVVVGLVVDALVTSRQRARGLDPAAAVRSRG